MWVMCWVARAQLLQAEAAGEGSLARLHNKEGEGRVGGVALGRVVARGLAQMRGRIVRLSVALHRCDADEAAELPAGVEPTPCAPWAASSIDCLADASYNESKCAMRNIQLWRKPAPQNEMEDRKSDVSGKSV